MAWPVPWPSSSPTNVLSHLCYCYGIFYLDDCLNRKLKLRRIFQRLTISYSTNLLKRLNSWICHFTIQLRSRHSQSLKSKSVSTLSVSSLNSNAALDQVRKSQFFPIFSTVWFASLWHWHVICLVICLNISFNSYNHLLRIISYILTHWNQPAIVFGVIMQESESNTVKKTEVSQNLPDFDITPFCRR